MSRAAWSTERDVRGSRELTPALRRGSVPDNPSEQRSSGPEAARSIARSSVRMVSQIAHCRTNAASPLATSAAWPALGRSRRGPSSPEQFALTDDVIEPCAASPLGISVP